MWSQQIVTVRLGDFDLQEPSTVDASTISISQVCLLTACIAWWWTEWKLKEDSVARETFECVFFLFSLLFSPLWLWRKALSQQIKSPGTPISPRRGQNTCLMSLSCLIQTSTLTSPAKPLSSPPLWEMKPTLLCRAFSRFVLSEIISMHFSTWSKNQLFILLKGSYDAISCFPFL